MGFYAKYHLQRLQEVVTIFVTILQVYLRYKHVKSTAARTPGIHINVI